MPRLYRPILACLILLSALVHGRSKATSPPVDSDYVYALATANNFLHAWQSQDQETAILLLSDRLKQHIVETTLDSHLNSKAKPQSFEIGRGKKLRSDRYQFPIALFPAPSNVRTMRPQMATLLVIKTGKNEWAIDKLP
ncbi:MAG: hypothetical protein DMG81_00515 [Acidobacteria bacterium]|nr:MAG: hypothetical protein DMG81_00515 [Acidobacteriota bacterium]